MLFFSITVLDLIIWLVNMWQPFVIRGNVIICTKGCQILELYFSLLLSALNIVRLQELLAFSQLPEPLNVPLADNGWTEINELGTRTAGGKLFRRIWSKTLPWASADGSPWSSAGGCSVVALWGGNVDGATEVLCLPSLDVAGIEAAYGDVDLRFDFVALSILAWVTKKCDERMPIFLIRYSYVLN